MSKIEEDINQAQETAKKSSSRDNEVCAISQCQCSYCVQQRKDEKKLLSESQGDGVTEAGRAVFSSKAVVYDALSDIYSRYPNGPTAIIAGTKNVLAGDPLPNRIYGLDGSLIPLGFKSADDFCAFSKVLYSELNRNGFDDVTPIFQGSSVTGFKGFDKVKNGIVSRSAGTIFDTGGISDFDVALGSPKMLAKAQGLGVPVIGQGTRTFELNNRTLKKLDLYNMRQSLQAQANRPVNFVIFDSSNTAVSKANTYSLLVRRN